MKRISEAIREVVLRQPFLEEALRHGFLNLTSFSEYIRPSIEAETQKSVSVHAIKMALSRLPRIGEAEVGKYTKIFQKISTCSNLSLLTLPRTQKHITMITELMIDRRAKLGRFFTLIEGIHEVDLIFASEESARIDVSIHHTLPTLRLDHLGLITCELENHEMMTPWLFYEVTKGFAFHGINIVQILSTTHELGVIIHETDMKQAMNVLMT